MDGTSIALLVAVIFIVIIGVVLMVLYFDSQQARQARRNNERRHQLQGSQPPQLPLPQNNRIVFGSSAEQVRQVASTRQPPARNNPNERIQFGSVNEPTAPTEPIVFGAVVGNSNKCMLCTGVIEPTQAIVECKGCHARLHQACWEDPIRFHQACPHCNSTGIERVYTSS